MTTHRDMFTILTVGARRMKLFNDLLRRLVRPLRTRFFSIQVCLEC